MQRVRISLQFVISFAVCASMLRFAVPAHAADIRSILFPVLGGARYSDDYGDARVGHTHVGNDLFNKKMQPLVAAVTGFVRFVVWPQATYGYYVTITDSDGYRYNYLHINNDTPGTDDGSGAGDNAYAPGMEDGAPVVQGQLIGWLGDSGNAESTSPHLHFEIQRPDGAHIDPFPSLQSSTVVNKITVAPALPGEILPYAEFRGGASGAVGDVDGDPTTQELVTGAGPGGGPQVRVFDASGNLRSQFFAYNETFRGGVDVAVADLDGDGVAEIITAPGAGLKPEIRVYSMHGVLKQHFLAYSASMQKGVNVAATDFDGNGIGDIVTAPKAGGSPQVRTFLPDGTVRGQFFAYGQSFRGGVDVAVIPAPPEKSATIVTGAGPGGGAQVRMFSPQGVVQGQFFPYGDTYHGGVRVSTGELDASSLGEEIVTVPASDASADVRMFDTHATQLDQENAFEPWWTGGFDIAAGSNVSYISSAQGPRRASVRKVFAPNRFQRGY